MLKREFLFFGKQIESIQNQNTTFRTFVASWVLFKRRKKTHKICVRLLLQREKESIFNTLKFAKATQNCNGGPQNVCAAKWWTIRMKSSCGSSKDNKTTVYLYLNTIKIEVRIVKFNDFTTYHTARKLHWKTHETQLIWSIFWVLKSLE